MAVYTVTRSYHTKGNMGMIDVTGDFQSAVDAACREKKIRSGIITGFTTGGEPGLVGYDVREAMQGIAPYRDENGNVRYYHHHNTWGDDNGSSHIHSLIMSPFITVPFVDGRITVGPWQNLTLVECDTRNREREIVFQVMGE